MKRDPSIHISLSRFYSILKELEVEDFPIGQFFSKARKNSLDSRSISVSNNKIAKQVNTIALASHGDAQLVAEIIYATRIKLKQRGVRQITQANTREWSTCKKLADICNQFCDDFGFDTRSGFIKYIELGINRCAGNNKNLPQRLIAMAENITNSYEAEREIQEYTSKSSIKDEVSSIHDYYVKYIASSTGITEIYKEIPEKYVHFCRIHKLIKCRHWDPNQYVKAQFEALSFCNGIPSPETMYGDKAIERFNKYLYKQYSNKNDEEDTPTIKGSLWDKIK